MAKATERSHFAGVHLCTLEAGMKAAIAAGEIAAHALLDRF